MPADETFCTLRFRGSFESAAITRHLGLVPTRTFDPGDLIGNGRSDRRFEHSGWFLESRHIVESHEIEEHLAWLLDQLEPGWHELAEILTPDIAADVDCFWSSIGTSGGPWIPPEAMARLGALGLPLLISFYYSEIEQ